MSAATKRSGRPSGVGRPPKLKPRDRRDWEHQAVCRDYDPELFFPVSRDDVDAGKSICRICPVRTDCLDEALAHDEIHGTRGGLDQWERAKLTGRKHIR